MSRKIMKIATLFLGVGLLIIVFLDKPWLHYQFPKNNISIHSNGHVIAVNKDHKEAVLSSVSRILRTTYDMKDHPPLDNNLQRGENLLMVHFQKISFLRVNNTNIHVSEIIIPLNSKNPSFVEIGTDQHLFWCNVRPWEIWFLRNTYQSYIQNHKEADPKLNTINTQNDDLLYV